MNIEVTYNYFIPGEGFAARGSAFPYKGEDFPPHKIAWCCPVCGELWARAVPSPEPKWELREGQPAVTWIFKSWPCRKHTHFSHVPGSLLLNNPSKKRHAAMFWAQVVDYMPEELLKRELELTLNFYESQK